MKFESYAFDEISQVVGASDDVRVRVGGRATYGDGPSMSMSLGSRFFLLRGEETGGISVDDWTVNA